MYVLQVPWNKINFINTLLASPIGVTTEYANLGGVSSESDALEMLPCPSPRKHQSQSSFKSPAKETGMYPMYNVSSSIYSHLDSSSSPTNSTNANVLLIFVGRASVTWYSI